MPRGEASERETSQRGRGVNFGGPIARSAFRVQRDGPRKGAKDVVPREGD